MTIYVALDYDGQQKNIDLARSLADSVDSSAYGFKINLDSVADFAPDALNPHDLVNAIQSFGKPVFVDMKMWNGGRTMVNIAKGCGNLGVDILNMYPHAGGKFMDKVAKALDGTKTELFGLTVLTHYTDKDTQLLYGKSLQETVSMLADISAAHGAKGLVVPGTQLATVQGLALDKLCPAVRPVWYENRKDNNQEQTITPGDAIRAGAKHLVVGSPIRKSENPGHALVRIIEECEEANQKA